MNFRVTSQCSFYKTCIYVTEPAKRDVWNYLRAIFQQMLKKITAHVLMDFCQAA